MGRLRKREADQRLMRTRSMIVAIQEHSPAYIWSATHLTQEAVKRALPEAKWKSTMQTNIKETKDLIKTLKTYIVFTAKVGGKKKYIFVRKGIKEKLIRLNKKRRLQKWKDG